MSVQIIDGNISLSDIVYSGASQALALQKSAESATAINATATASTAAILGGIITSTTAAAVTITTPTAAQLLAALGAAGYRTNNGDVFKLIVLNLGNANAITMAGGINVAFSANNSIIGASSKVLFYWRIIDNTGVANPSIQFY